MDLVHDFTVPVGREQTWAAFNDLEGVAGCFPGATVTGVEGDAFEGSVKVKLGPIALVYNGSGTITGKDQAAGTLLLSAKGKDKRGNGTASAQVTVTMAGSGPDETSVHVETVLQITGKPAQFGRSVMQDVSDKLLDQFTACLAHKLGDPVPVADQAPAVEAEVPDAPPAPTLAPPGATSVPPAPAERSDDAIDLGSTVLPVLARTYWRQVVAGVVALLVLRRVAKRRR